MGRRPLGAILHSSNEPGELSQWFCDDDSTINIVLVIIIYYYYYLSKKSSDFDEILYTAADFELDELHVIKNEKVGLDRLQVRQNVFLVRSSIHHIQSFADMYLF